MNQRHRQMLFLLPRLLEDQLGILERLRDMRLRREVARQHFLALGVHHAGIGGRTPRGGEEAGVRKPAPKRAEKLDPFKGYIVERLKAAAPDLIPASVLYREIEGRGYTGGATRVKQFVRGLRVELVVRAGRRHRHDNYRNRNECLQIQQVLEHTTDAYGLDGAGFLRLAARSLVSLALSA